LTRSAAASLPRSARRREAVQLRGHPDDVPGELLRAWPQRFVRTHGPPQPLLPRRRPTAEGPPGDHRRGRPRRLHTRKRVLEAAGKA